jgi:hypothetical protein
MGMPTPKTVWQHNFYFFFKTKNNNMNFKNKIKTIAVLVFSAFFVLTGCKKDDHVHDDDHAEPTITFQSPTQGARLNETDTLWLRVNLASEDDLHDYILEVTKIADGVSVYKYDGHSHNKSVTTNLYFMPNVEADTEMKLLVKTLDHNGKATEKSITFTVLNTQQATKPTINIISPNSGMANNGQTLSIKGNITHDKNLKSARIWLTQNNTIVMDYTKNSIATNTFAFDTTHVINATTHSDYVLTISGTDVNDIEASKTVSFHVHP